MNSNPYWLVCDNKSWFLGRHSDDYFGRQQGSWLFALFNLPGFNGGIKHCGENRCLSSAAAERLNREKLIKKSDFPRRRESLCAASVLFLFFFTSPKYYFYFSVFCCCCRPNKRRFWFCKSSDSECDVFSLLFLLLTWCICIASYSHK